MMAVISRSLFSTTLGRRKVQFMKKKWEAESPTPSLRPLSRTSSLLRGTPSLGVAYSAYLLLPVSSRSTSRANDHAATQNQSSVGDRFARGALKKQTLHPAE